MLEVRPEELSDYWEFTTTASVDTQTLDDDDYILITGDGYVDGYDLAICFDSGTWFANWPETTTYSESRPTEALFYGGVLYMNPPPDDAYDVKIPAFVRPATMTLLANNLIVNNLLNLAVYPNLILIVPHLFSEYLFSQYG